MQLTIQVSDLIAARAQARGVAPEVYAEQLVQDAVGGEDRVSNDGEALASIRAAVDRLRERRQGRRLNGLSIQEMVQEGRKY